MDIDKARTRSVDNLQRLYTVVVSLAVTESLKGLLSNVSSGGVLPTYDRWLMFVSLIVTVIPFYHGANRYLDATYVTEERSSKYSALMPDFIVLFVEGLLLFVLAMVSKDENIFYPALAGLLILDTVWVLITTHKASTKYGKAPHYIFWAIINVIASCLLCIFVWSHKLFDEPIWGSPTYRSIALMLVVIIRTIIDYISVWQFYYPKGVSEQGNALSPYTPPEEKSQEGTPTPTSTGTTS